MSRNYLRLSAFICVQILTQVASYDDDLANAESGVNINSRGEAFGHKINGFRNM